MKIVIDIEDCSSYGLSPNYVYKRLCNEHTEKLNRKYKCSFGEWQHSVIPRRGLYTLSQPIDHKVLKALF